MNDPLAYHGQHQVAWCVVLLPVPLHCKPLLQSTSTAWKWTPWWATSVFAYNHVSSIVLLSVSHFFQGKVWAEAKTVTRGCCLLLVAFAGIVTCSLFHSATCKPVLCISVCLLKFCPTRGDLFTSNLVLSRSQTTILRTRLGCTVGSGVAGLRCCTEVCCDFLLSERFQEPPEVRKSIYLSNSPVS